MQSLRAVNHASGQDDGSTQTYDDWLVVDGALAATDTAPGSDFLGFGAVAATSSSAAAATGSGASTATSGATGSLATAPSWVLSLTDSVIKADMAAADVAGTVSEAGMAKLFTDLAAELTTGKTTLSASQLADLQTINKDLNVGETASAYLTYVVSALVAGSAANATYTGGAASATALGNLKAGTTATQLTELAGKWLLGSDLPSSTVSMSGVKAFSVTYATVSNPVFAASGPGINDVNQGYLGDCYLLASLAEVAYQQPSLITSMITSNGNNTYGVRFYVNGKAEYVTVNNALPDGGKEFNDATDIWASLIEKAYAQAQALGVITGNSVNDGNSFSTIGNGGFPEFALEAVTDAPYITDFSAARGSWTLYDYNDSLQTVSAASGLSTSAVTGAIAADLAAGCDLVLDSCTNATDSKGKITLVAAHAMSIYGYDSATGMLEIRNPWGTTPGQTWDTTFEVSVATLLADGDTIAVADTTQSPAPVGVATTSVATSTLNALQGASGLNGGTAIATFTESGGLSGDSYGYALGGAAASKFAISTAGVLSTAAGGVSGGTNGAVEQLTVTATDNTDHASSPATAINVVIGGSGADTVNLAALGALVASAPTFVYGLAGNDVINASGLTGPVFIDGGAGADAMTASATAATTFEYGAVSDSTPTAMDVISGFNASLDVIDLTGIGSVALGTPKALATTATTIGADSIGWATSGGNTFVYVNNTAATQALTAASMKIELTGSVALSAANFTHH